MTSYRIKIFKVAKIASNALTVLFFLLTAFSLIRKDIGFFFFSLSFLALVLFIKLFLALIALRMTPERRTSTKIMKAVAVLLFLIGIFIFIFIFFQHWRLFFEANLMPKAYPEEYQSFIQNLKLLSYGSFIVMLSAVWMILKRRWLYLVIPFLLIPAFGVIALRMGWVYFPDIAFPAAPSVAESVVHREIYYPYSRLVGMILFLPFFSIVCAFLLWQSVEIFKQPKEVRVSFPLVIGYYLALIGAVIFGFIALATTQI